MNTILTMDQITHLLQEVGLTTTEASLYRHGLSHGPATIATLVRITGTKRPTTYHAIKTLKEKGLVSETIQKNKPLYSMADPEQIRSLINRQKELLEQQEKKLSQAIDLLHNTARANIEQKNSVVHVNGPEGVKMIMDQAFYCKKKQWDVIAPYHNFLRDYDSEYAKRYLHARKYYGITARTLWEQTPVNTKRLDSASIQARQPRIMPKHMHGTFSSMMILFDDKVAIFSSAKNLSAVLITSQETRDMIGSMFEGIWQQSERYK